jgi:hypothetical protein
MEPSRGGSASVRPAFGPRPVTASRRRRFTRHRGYFAGCQEASRPSRIASFRVRKADFRKNSASAWRPYFSSSRAMSAGFFESSGAVRGRPIASIAGCGIVAKTSAWSLDSQGIQPHRSLWTSHRPLRNLTELDFIIGIRRKLIRESFEGRGRSIRDRVGATINRATATRSRSRRTPFRRENGVRYYSL